jgi:hypothetical protein
MGMGTSMTNQNLKEIMERMTRMFQAKLKENSSDKIVSVSKTSQVIQRIELLFNNIKLERTRNYLNSSRMALSNLQVKRLKKYVTGEYIEPENKESAEWKMCSNTNSLIVSWLLSFVSPNIARMVESVSSAAQVWKVLIGMYFEAGSVMMIEVAEKIDATI